jgi:hypothetical protein
MPQGDLLVGGLSMSPAFRMSPAVSSRAFASGLIFFFFTMVYLLNNAF